MTKLTKGNLRKCSLYSKKPWLHGVISPMGKELDEGGGGQWNQRPEGRVGKTSKVVKC